jgi:hypothetical protein
MKAVFQFTVFRSVDISVDDFDPIADSKWDLLELAPEVEGLFEDGEIVWAKVEKDGREYEWLY